MDAGLADAFDEGFADFDGGFEAAFEGGLEDGFDCKEKVVTIHTFQSKAKKQWEHGKEAIKLIRSYAHHRQRSSDSPSTSNPGNYMKKYDLNSPSLQEALQFQQRALAQQ